MRTLREFQIERFGRFDIDLPYDTLNGKDALFIAGIIRLIIAIVILFNLPLGVLNGVGGLFYLM